MRRRVELVAAPVGMTPGGYVATAYAGHTVAATPAAEMAASRVGEGWRIEIEWACPAPVRALDGQPTRFVDAAALLVPAVDDAPWVTMGAPEKPVEGVLWRADRDRPARIRAHGLGTAVRAAAPEAWRAESMWENGRWRVAFALADWPALERSRRLGIALWRGADGERASLKSVSPGWLPLEAGA